MIKEIIINSNNYDLHTKLYEASNPKAIIQIIHGMEEHQERYADFALFCVQNNFSVMTSNMRGHGKDAPILGYFGKKNGYQNLIDDQLKITNFLKNKYPDKPIYLFAHSMGSIIARNVLQKASKQYDKVILCGYPNPNPLAGAGIFLCNLTKLFKGGKGKSRLIHNIAIGPFNKCIKKPRTKLDWLSHNKENVDKYIADELCGFGFKIQGFKDLFTLLKRMSKIKLYTDVHDSLPILLIRGLDDPCPGFDKGATNSLNILRKCGFKNIDKINYPNMRHEILNEENNELVYNDVIEFFTK